MGVEALQLNVRCIMFDEAWLGTVRCVCVSVYVSCWLVIVFRIV